MALDLEGHSVMAMLLVLGLDVDSWPPSSWFLLMLLSLLRSDSEYRQVAKIQTFFSVLFDLF